MGLRKKVYFQWYSINFESLPAGFCDIGETMDTMEEGILSNLGERLSTSGWAGSAHVTDATQEQINIDEYPGLWSKYWPHVGLIWYHFDLIMTVSSH